MSVCRNLFFEQGCGDNDAPKTHWQFDYFLANNQKLDIENSLVEFQFLVGYTVVKKI